MKRARELWILIVLFVMFLCALVWDFWRRVTAAQRCTRACPKGICWVACEKVSEQLDLVDIELKEKGL